MKYVNFFFNQIDHNSNKKIKNNELLVLHVIESYKFLNDIPNIVSKNIEINLKIDIVKLKDGNKKYIVTNTILEDIKNNINQYTRKLISTTGFIVDNDSKIIETIIDDTHLNNEN